METCLRHPEISNSRAPHPRLGGQRDSGAGAAPRVPQGEGAHSRVGELEPRGDMAAGRDATGSRTQGLNAHHSPL